MFLAVAVMGILRQSRMVTVCFQMVVLRLSKPHPAYHSPVLRTATRDKIEPSAPVKLDGEVELLLVILRQVRQALGDHGHHVLDHDFSSIADLHPKKAHRAGE